MRLKEQFKDINEEDLKLLRNSYDIVGDIAILEVDPKLKKYEKKIVAKERQIKRDLELVRKEMGLRG